MPIPQLVRKVQNNHGSSWRQNSTRLIKKVVKNTGGWRRDENNEPLTWKQKLFNKRAFKVYGYLLLAFVLFCIAGYYIIGRGLPDPNKLIERQVAQSTKIYDRTGKTVLYEIFGGEKRTLVSLNDIPMNVRNATIAIEDKNFYNHGGFSVLAILRTVFTNIVLGRKAGASTLTQQFIKNSVLSNEKTYIRKLKEVVLAYKMEKQFTKDEILQMYLNEIPYGSTAYGVEAASQKYFAKNVKDLNLAESAILASLPQAPSRYSPYGPNKDALIARQHYVLDVMAKQGYIKQEEADEAKKTELKFTKPTDNILAPHFVMYVKDLLSEKYGDKTVESGGLKIITTLDYEKQKIAEEVITEKTPKNEEKYQATNAALVSIDPKTGQVLAMVGSKDYFSDKIDGQYNVVTATRQPGSSFKPIVYTAAFIKGYTPDTVLYDVDTNFSTDPNKEYTPHNYDLGERGPLTIRKALAGSLNIPAVKAIYLTGMNNVLDLADKLGYTTLKDRSQYGLSLVLGGGEVKLLEHANAYTALANEGVMHPTSVILRVEDQNGNALEEFKQEDQHVLETQITRLTTSVLSDNSARAYVFGEKNNLTLPGRPVAAKTGTTNDYKDAWTVGYTPSLVTGVWVGNNDYKSMKRGADGSIVAAPIWHDYMMRALKDTPIENFTSPTPIKTGKAVLDGDTSGGQILKIDRASGLLATELTPANYIEERLFSQPHDILYYVDKDNPRGPIPDNPAIDPQFTLWESAVQAWLAKKSSSTLATSSAPTTYDNLHIKENWPVFNIISPNANQTINGDYLEVTINATAPRGIGRADYYLDGNLVSSVTSYPFNLNKNISFLTAGYHDLLVRVCDDIDNCSEEKVTINLNPTTQNNNISPVEGAWLEPANGVIANNIDFPLKLKINLTNPAQTAKVVVYYQSASSTENKILTTLSPIENNPIEGLWKKPTTKNIYTYWAEIISWSGKTFKTDTQTISIN